MAPGALLVALALVSGTAKIAFLHHGNQSFADNGIYALVPGSPGYNGNSFHRTLDSHFYWGVPVDIHISGPLAQSYAWLRNDNGLLDRLKNPLVDLAAGTYAEHILPYVASEINAFSFWYSVQVDSALIKKPGWPDYPTVVWIPERVWKSEALMPYSLIALLNQAFGKYGYTSGGQYVWIPPVIVLDDNVHDWYPHQFPSGADCHNPFKVHRMYDGDGNMVFVVFISQTARDQMVWNDVSQSGNPLHQLLWNLANDWDQSQFVLYGDDWEKAAGVAGWDFGQAGAPANSYDHNIAWIAQQSWIQPIHVAEAAKWWGLDYLYDSDPLNDPPVIQIDYAAYPELHGWTGGTYDNWYNDFKATQALDCGLLDDQNGNGVRGDYEDLWLWSWNHLLPVPDTRIAQTGWITLSGMLYETAWHEGPGGPLVYWGKNLWNHTRMAGGFAFGSQWYDSLRFLGGSHVTVLDADGDSLLEYALWNSEICAIFDRRGGRALWMFTRDGDVVIGNLMTNWGNEGDYDDGGHPGLLHDTEAWNSWFDVSVDTSRADTALLVLNEAYDSQGQPDNSLHKRIQLVSGQPYLDILYSSSGYNWTKSGVSPDLYGLLLGQEARFISGLTDSGWTYAGFEAPNGTRIVYLWGDGQGLSFYQHGKMASGAYLMELGGRSGLWRIWVFAGRGEPEVHRPGPGDHSGPVVWDIQQAPDRQILPSDSVRVLARAEDPSGVASLWLHYGVNGTWTYPDIPMHRDDGATYDWDGDGQPTPDLFGGYLPPQAYGSEVEYVIHAFDSLNNDAWASNNGQNFRYTVGVVRFYMDGRLDRVAQLLAQNGDMHLWAYLDADSGQLYVATEAAGDGPDAFSNDHFIFVLFHAPQGTHPAPWAKSGLVAPWSYYLADENDNGFTGWFDASENLMSDTLRFQNTSGDSVLEGVIHLRRLLGSLPDTIYLAVATYGTADGAPLEWQVPMPHSQDGNLDPDEYVRFRAVVTFVLDGTPDTAVADSVAAADGQVLYAAYVEDSGKLYVAAPAPAAGETRFLFVATRFPYDSMAAPAGNQGVVGEPLAYLQASGGTRQWYRQNGTPLGSPTAQADPGTGAWMEGVLYLGDLLDTLPRGLYLAVGSYRAGTLAFQIPEAHRPNGNLEGFEYANLRLVTVAGDADGDGRYDLHDAIYTGHYLFDGWPAPVPFLIADRNGDHRYDPLDLAFMVAELWSPTRGLFLKLRRQPLPARKPQAPRPRRGRAKGTR